MRNEREPNRCVAARGGRGRPARPCLLAALLLASVAAVASASESDTGARPVYVGWRACLPCHEKEGGKQFSIWWASAHARAYAALARPEAPRITLLSGIPTEPQAAPVCLGCHATAADTERWERDPAFRIEDGVQCEMCHGPASEHVAEHQEPSGAPQKGMLRMPGPDACAYCHQSKGSHEAVLEVRAFDAAAAMAAIAHPRAAEDAPERPAEMLAFLASGDAPPEHGREFVGVRACAECHRGPSMGYQASRWRLSRHALAYARLGTPAAAAIAAAKRPAAPLDPQQDPECLKCHATGAGAPRGAFAEGFEIELGVQCEACHGPGSEYMAEAVMLDRAAARQAGLQAPTEEVCRRCHIDRPEHRFDFEAARRKIAHPTRPAAAAANDTDEPGYKTPVNLALAPDGRELFVACEAAGSIIVVDVARRQAVAEIAIGGQVNDVCFSPDGRNAYVTSRLEDLVAVVDVARREVTARIPVGDDPHGVLTDAAGSRLYVLNTSSDDISVIDAAELREVKRLVASRNPWSLSLSPDGRRLFVSNNLSRFVPFRAPSVSEVTVIDPERAVVEDRYPVGAANLLQGVAWHPSGEYAMVTLNRTKNLVPMTRLVQGWTITNGIAIVWRDGRVDQLLLDESDRCFPDPADVAFTPDGGLALITSSGSDRVAVVDLARLRGVLDAASADERARALPNHTGLPTEFIRGYVSTGISPRGIAVDRAGRFAYVADALADTVTVIDLADLATARIDLGGPRRITIVRRGERLFHSAERTFHGQFSCHSCHPDGHIDGLTYDIEPDGIGFAPVDNRTLRGILDTAPFKWEGTNPSLKRQCGPRLAVFFTRIDPFTMDELEALDMYICTIPQPPNRFRGVGEDLTPAQRRGKFFFERVQANDGRAIAENGRCITCHPPPYYTDRLRHDVGTRMWLDHVADFDTPQLTNIYGSAPYLHNGIAPTLEEIWTVYNPENKHGLSNDMTKDQLNDLIEFLKTL